MKSFKAVTLLTVFETDVLYSKRRLQSAERWGKFLTILTLGITRNQKSIDEASKELEKCKAQHSKYRSLLGKAKQLDDQLLQTIELEGVRVSNNTFADLPVLGAEGYPRDWENLRETILSRDNYECQEKDARCSGPLQIHHIVPLSKGGTNNSNNLVTLCMYHHCIKHEHMRVKYYANLWR